MATPQIWRRVVSHARRSPDRHALTTGDGSLTYAELVAAVDAVDRSDDVGGIRTVRADRHTAAVTAVLAAQAAIRAVLVVPTDAGAAYLDRVERDLRRLAASPGPLHGAWGLWTMTSGSTGTPKIVAHDPGGIDRFVDWARTRLDLGPDTVSLNLSPLNFDITIMDVWAVLASGGHVILAPEPALAGGPATARLLRMHRPTLLQAVPFALVRSARAADPTPHVRTVVSTGDFFPLPALPDVSRAFPSAELLSVYGSTETNDSFIADLRRCEAGELGAPIEGVRHRVEAAVPGQPAELVVSTPFQALGYANAPDTPWTIGEDDQREFHTGDLVIPGQRGGLRLVGRTDRQVKVRGVRISLDAVESVLRNHDDVIDAVAVTAPGSSGDGEIVAAVHVAAGGAASNLGLRAAAAAALPRVAVPSRLLLTSSPFPLTATGKTDRLTAVTRLLDG